MVILERTATLSGATQQQLVVTKVVGVIKGAGTATGPTGGGIVTGGIGKIVVQADKSEATTLSETDKLRRVNNMGIRMWLLILEAIVAMFLLVFIVWWTMYSGRPTPPHEEPAAPALPDESDRQDKPPFN